MVDALRRRFPPSFWTGTGLLISFAAIALLARWLAPFDPTSPEGRPLQLPGNGHLLGTNDLGQDVLSQLIYGTRTTLGVAIGVVLISTVLSWLVGITAGMSRLLEAPLMMLADLILALPVLPLCMFVLTLAGSSRLSLILALGLLSWPAYARIVRSVVIETRSAPYVEAARALGASPTRIAVRHLLPATRQLLPAKLVMTARYAIFTEATLAFLGLGSGGVSWGTMLSWAFADPLLFARPIWPWLVLPPVLAIALLVQATLWMSEGLGHPVTSARSRREGPARRSIVVARRPQLIGSPQPAPHPDVDAGLVPAVSLATASSASSHRGVGEIRQVETRR